MRQTSAQVALSTLLAVSGLLGSACKARRPVTVSIIAFNGFHGNLEGGNLRWDDTPVERRVGGKDLEVREAKLASQSPVAPPAAGRIGKVERCR